jgi:predicted permease
MVQVALSLILLVGAGLLIGSLSQLQREDPGFETERLLSVQIQIPPAQYNTNELRALFFSDLLEQMEALPDITAAAASDRLPFQGDGPWNGLYRPEYPPETPSDILPANRRFISDGYFRTMGIPLLAGREFEPSDMLNSQPVVVVNRALVDAYFPDEDALGKTLVLRWGDGIHMKIVGIVEDVPQSGPGSNVPAMFYIPVRQYPQTTMQLTLRSLGDPAAITGAVRSLIREADRNVPIWNVSTMEQRLDSALTSQRFAAFLLGLFAAVALILAIIGLYGILAYFVNQRTYEMGIRIALGAGNSNMLWMVLRRGMTLTFIGVAIGLAGSLGFSILLEGLLFGTGMIEPATYAIVSVILIVISIVACLVPARRAVRVDPLIAIRSE